MDTIAKLLPRAELLPLKLRDLYETYGYSKYTVSKFEPYDIYSENKSFLGNESIITFTDPSGRLMALKPDITLGMIKNIAPDMSSRKLYYCENVFRTDRSSGEFAEIRQTGLEYIGGDSRYAECEVVHLAMLSLEAIGEECVIAVSHMGYVSSLLDSYGFDDSLKRRIIEAVRHKDEAGIVQAASDAGLGDGDTKKLCDALLLYGNCRDTAQRMLAAARTEAMREAAAELGQLCDSLGGFGGKMCRLTADLSVINDFDYYNGLVMRGYIRSIPRSVLSGGRYDAMMRRLGKPQSAIGFALYLGELDRYLHDAKEYDADVLLVCGDAPARRVAEEVQRLTSEGFSVIAKQEDDGGVRVKKKQIIRGEA